MNHLNSRDEYVRQRSYELWEREGRPSGRADEFWLKAQASVIKRDGTWVSHDDPCGEGDQTQTETKEPSPIVRPAELTQAAPVNECGIVMFTPRHEFSMQTYFRAFADVAIGTMFLMPLMQFLLVANAALEASHTDFRQRRIGQY
jgi:hypothetical protein